MHTSGLPGGTQTHGDLPVQSGSAQSISRSQSSSRPFPHISPAGEGMHPQFGICRHAGSLQSVTPLQSLSAPSPHISAFPGNTCGFTSLQSPPPPPSPPAPPDAPLPEPWDVMPIVSIPVRPHAPNPNAGEQIAAHPMAKRFFDRERRDEKGLLMVGHPARLGATTPAEQWYKFPGPSGKFVT